MVLGWQTAHLDVAQAIQKALYLPREAYLPAPHRASQVVVTVASPGGGAAECCCSSQEPHLLRLNPRLSARLQRLERFRRWHYHDQKCLGGWNPIALALRLHTLTTDGRGWARENSGRLRNPLTCEPHPFRRPPACVWPLTLYYYT